MKLPEDFDPAERGERARNYFLEGYNCCQAVLLAFADVLEANGAASAELLQTVGSGFGGGFIHFVIRICEIIFIHTSDI